MAVLGLELGLSSSEVHAAMRRARGSGLLRYDLSGEPPSPPPPDEVQHSAVPGPPPRTRLRVHPQERPSIAAVLEFLVHGLKYVFPPQRGELTRGVPTSYAAPPLSRLIARGPEPIPVWPFPEGTVRGIAFEPLYGSVPFAALRDPGLYELLAIADALREGRARERKIAEEQLRQRLKRIDVG